MKQRKITFVLALALALTLVLTGCAGSAGKNANGVTDTASSTAEAATDGGYYSESLDYGEEVPGESQGVSGDETDVPQKLVYTADLTLETRDLNAALESLRARLDALGGTVQESGMEGLNPGDDTVSYTAARPRAVLTLRVPSERFSEFLGALQAEQELFTVRQASTRTENLTRRYVDLESRLKALRAEEEWLLQAMEKAENVTELLEIRDRLTDVRWEIESLTNSLQTIDYDADWSTVTVTLTQVERYSPQEQAGFGERIGGYFADSGENFLAFLEGVLHLLILALPFLVILGIVIAVVVAVVKRSNKKRRRVSPQDMSRGELPENKK